MYNYKPLVETITKDFAQHASALKEIERMESITRDFAQHASALKEIERMESITRDFAQYDSALKEIEKIESIAKAFLPSDSARDAVESMKGLSLYGAMKALTDESTFKYALESFNRSYNSSGLAGFSVPVNNHVEIDDFQVNEAINQLESIEDENSFKNIFPKLPIWIQAKIIWVFHKILAPTFVIVLAGILTPYIQNILSDDKKTKREQVNTAKKFLSKEHNITKDHFRFITGNNVRLRSKPSTSSAILDELVIGKVVKVIGKKRNWIEVEYTYEDGEILRGWVFARYTEKFKN